MMPDHRRRTEAQCPPLLLQTPTHIHVVPGEAELGIEPSDRLKARFAKRHVAPRDMFRLPIRKQHVCGAAGRVGDALGNGTVGRWRDVGAANSGVRHIHRVQERGRQILEPVRVGVGVVIDIRHDVPGRRLPARVAGVGKPAIIGANHPAVILIDDGCSAVRRAVIDDHHFVVRILQFLEARQTIADRSRAVVGANHHRDARPGHVPWEWHFSECFAHRRQRRLRLPIFICDTELPILHLRATPEPFIGPGVNEETRAPARKRRSKLPVQRFRLGCFTIPITVQSHLRHDQGPVARDIVQAGQVSIQAFLRFQINVEAGEIEEGELKVFGGRIIDIGHQALRVLCFHSIVEAFQKAFQFAPTVPANDRGRDFVADGVAKNRRMPCAGSDFGAHHLLNHTGAFAVIEKGHRPLDRKARHDPQTVPLRRVQQPERRRRVGAHRVHSIGRHLLKVVFHHLRRRKFLPLVIWAEGSVSDASNIQLFVTDKNEFASHLWTSARHALRRHREPRDKARTEGCECKRCRRMRPDPWDT